MNVDELIKEADTNLADQEVLADKLNTEEDAEKKTSIQVALDGKVADWEQLKGRIEQAKATLASKALLAELKAQTKTVQPAVDLAPKAPLEAKDHQTMESKRMEAFLNYCAGGDYLQKISGEEWKLLKPQGQWSRAPADAIGVPFSFVAKMFGGGSFHNLFANPAVREHYAGLSYGQSKALPLTSTQATGAAVIPQDFRATLLQLPGEAPHIMNLATITPAPTGTVTLPRLVQTDANEYGGVVVQEIAEAAEKPETEPEIEQIEIRTIETAAYTELSHNLLNRSVINLEALLTQLFRDAMLAHIDNRCMTGTGIGQILGMVNTAGIRVVTRQVANLVGYTDLVNLEHAVRAYHRGGAIWTAHDTVIQSLKLLTDVINRPLWIPNMNSGISAATPGSILGRNYLSTYRLNTLGQSGDIAFGNWRYYWIAIEENVTMAASDHYKFRDNVRAYKVWSKIGGRLIYPRTFSVLGEVES